MTTTTNSWIVLVSGTNGPGNGTATYSVLSNPNGFERVGAVMIGDQSLILTQKAAACTVSLPVSTANFGNNTNNSSFSVTSAGGCSWTVSNTNSWITITSSTTGSGNGTVSYSVSTNSGASRSGNITVTGASNAVAFAINQSALNCTFSLSSTNGAHGSGA